MSKKVRRTIKTYKPKKEDQYLNDLREIRDRMDVLLNQMTMMFIKWNQNDITKLEKRISALEKN